MTRKEMMIMIKKICALLLSCLIFMTGCADGSPPFSEAENPETATSDVSGTTSEQTDPADVTISDAEIGSDSPTDGTLPEKHTESPAFTGLDDPDLLRYLEDSVYAKLTGSFDSDDYFVENVEGVYVSKEYLEEVAYNSQENIYFGYTLSQLNEIFEGQGYIFTLGTDGQTTAEPMEAYDGTFENVVLNVAVGTGVILLCVTVSAVASGLGATAVSAIFAMSAKSAAAVGLSDGIIGAASAGIVKGVRSGDMSEALKEGVSAGSTGFMWGAIGGAVAGGSVKAARLKGATLNGLTINEAALIQKESKYPVKIIKQMHSKNEYDVYREAGLYTEIVDGKAALIQDIDLDYVSPEPDGTLLTNLQRMAKGKAPIDPESGKPFELHHIGQKNDATLAVLTSEQHRSKETTSVLHEIQETEIDRREFDKTRKKFWKDLAKKMEGDV